MKWVFETGKEQTLIPSVYPIQSSNGRSSNERSGAFDLQDLMERVHYDQDLLETIVMMFECDAIKGMLLNFSARDAADTAFALELLGHSNRWTKAAEWLGNLRQQVDELDIWLNRLLERQAS
jgi:hypothetical protein